MTDRKQNAELEMNNDDIRSFYAFIKLLMGIDNISAIQRTYQLGNCSVTDRVEFHK